MSKNKQQQGQGQGQGQQQATKVAAPSNTMIGALLKGAESSQKQEEYRKNYKVMHIGVGQPDHARYKDWEEMMKIAQKLDVKESEIVWYAINRLLEDAKAGKLGETRQDIIGLDKKRSTHGTSPGFWIIPIYTEGKVTDIVIKEVEQRREVGEEGRTFFPYPRDDEKARARAERQALRARDTDLRMVGLKPKDAK